VLMTEATKERFYERVRVENLQANFSRKMYFWPILERELQWNRRMTQAPGWETFD
ncbi:RagB/SusD family nutrient uptake outer membrane protein, partial [Bacteroides thetaiotaomicron]